MRIEELSTQVSLLTDLVFKLLEDGNNIKWVCKRKIQEVLGWTDNQFAYRKEYLKPFGLKKIGQWKMPVKGLYEYQKQVSNT